MVEILLSALVVIFIGAFYWAMRGWAREEEVSNRALAAALHREVETRAREREAREALRELMARTTKELAVTSWVKSGQAVATSVHDYVRAQALSATP